ncbi:hypothetical protein HDU96_005419 [Phlyctochytrium bullatum]|nr:hypothetical protein HDU96_005419 [Phlyctochytrium bullatum]
MDAHPSFPTELLRTVFLHVYPNDLITVAAANRHLHRAVPQCIDYALAKRHVLEENDRGGFYDNDARSIYYNHHLLFKHTVAVFAVFGIKEIVA